MLTSYIEIFETTPVPIIRFQAPDTAKIREA
jgi:hypothetical protein